MLLLLSLSLSFKLALITSLARGFGAPMGVSLRVGLYLAQAGELGLVLLTLAGQNNLVPPALFNPILASMVISMLATPFMIMYTNSIVTPVVGSDWLMQSVQMTNIARKSINADKHVIICGYGRCGQNLARLLEAGTDSPTWRSTWIPTGCARPLRLAIRSSSVTPRACRPSWPPACTGPAPWS